MSGVTDTYTDADPRVSWDASDLSRRLRRAIELAIETVEEFGDGGWVDDEAPALSFGPEKVVAEAAMLAWAAAGSDRDPELRARLVELCERLESKVGAERVLADVAGQPARAFKYAVPHVLLGALGHVQPDRDRFLGSRCARTAGLANDLPPSALLERAWLTRLWNTWEGSPVEDPSQTLLDAPIDVLSEPREDAYALTHELFYLTDFGRERIAARRPAVDVGRVLTDVESLVLRYLDAGDYDLTGELLMAWPQLQAEWSPTAAFALRVLARVEDEVGVLLCGNLDTQRMERLDDAPRRRYARATGYHTAFVMGFLCAVALRSEVPPPREISGPEYPDSVVERLWDLIDIRQGHWAEDFSTASSREQRALAPMLCHLVIVQGMRRHDFVTVNTALRVAAEAGMPDHPLRSAAMDRLLAWGEAMSVSGATRPALP